MLVGVLGLLLPSCDLDRYPTDTIVLERALETFADAQQFRNGFYSFIRSLNYGTASTTTELMSDLFNAAVGYGLRGNAPHTLSEAFPGAGEVSGIWNTAFHGIAQINSFLYHVQNLSGLNEAQQAGVNDFIAEAHYTRAFLYTVLATHFMPPISDANRNTANLGLPLLTRFDVNYRPSRATIQETFDFIIADLEVAQTISVIHGETTGEGATRASRHRITRDAVYALKARVLFMMRDNEGAVRYALYLIDSGRYPLVSSSAAFTAMWHNDGGTAGASEDIFILHASPTVFGPTMGIFGLFSSATNTFNPDFIPTQRVIDLYGAGDWRLSTFFSDGVNQMLNNGGMNHPGIRILQKFPGNPALRPAGAPTNHAHFAKVHRIAEMHLIVAEATQSAMRLNVLRAARGATPIFASGEALRDAIRDEWVREMIGEGRRIESLRRWGIGFDGRPPQSRYAVVSYGSSEFTHRQVGPNQFYRFTLPIPITEMRRNPNMVQNPGWGF